MIDNEHSIEESAESFEEMLEQSLRQSEGAEIGEAVSGTIVSIASDSAFVDIAGKTDALINISEYTDDEGNVTVSTGDSVQGYIVSARSGEVFITEKIGLGFFSPEILSKAYREKIPVYGRVSGVTKGGYTVTLPGVQCFCPLSQIDLKVPSNPEVFLNRVLQFSVTEFAAKGRRTVLSRRTLLETIRDRREKELRGSLNVGDRVKGTVMGVQNFGVFVDIGGFQALLPKSEASWSRRDDLSSFTVGSEIEVSVKAIDWEDKKITLSIKDLLPEPWEKASSLSIGDEVRGRVVNIIKNGVFVELFPGLEGFIHISNLNSLKNVRTPDEVVSREDMVTARIVGIKPGEKKIALELVSDGPDPWQTPGDELLNSIHDATVESVKTAGLSARLANGMLGFIPREELRGKKSGEVTADYSVGSTLKVVIKRLDPQGKRMILTEEGAFRRAEKEEYEQFIRDDASSKVSSLGSMLKDKFDKIKKDMGE